MIAIIGGRGFLGQALKSVITYDCVSRQGPLYLDDLLTPDQFKKYDIIINLAGQTIDSWPWTKKKKKVFLDSRIGVIDKIVQMAHQANHSPWLIQASGISYYGIFTHSLHQQSEYDPPEESDTFMQYLAQAIEKKTKAYPGMTSALRLAPVLDSQHGVFPKLTLLSRCGLHLVPGTGSAALPWIHVDDFTRAMQWIISHRLYGPINLIAPTQNTIKEFYQQLKNKQGGLIGHVPSWCYRWSLGEMSQLILGGTKASPQVLTESGFVFQYEHLSQALNNLLIKN